MQEQQTKTMTLVLLSLMPYLVLLLERFYSQFAINHTLKNENYLNNTST